MIAGKPSPKYRGLSTQGLLDSCCVGIAQAGLWVLTAVGFLATQVDRNGSYVSVPGATTYLMICLAAMMAVPIAYDGPTPIDDSPGRNGFVRWVNARIKDFTKACTSPCLVLIELAVILGNISPWVFSEPLLLAGVGNISVVQPRKIQSSRPAVAPSGSVVAHGDPRSGEVQLTSGSITIAVRTNAVTNATYACLAVGGVGGGFDSPANELYGQLSKDLQGKGILMLDVRFREPGNLERSIDDLQMAINYCKQLGISRFLLMGHSFGGAVVVKTALLEPAVSSVITMSTQTYGCERVAQLAPRSILLIHGFFDFLNPRYCSEDIWHRALEPKTLRLVPGTHMLNECAGTVHDLVLQRVFDEAKTAPNA